MSNDTSANSVGSISRVAFEEIEHTADRAIRIFGSDLRELLLNAAAGLNSLLATEHDGRTRTRVHGAQLHVQHGDALAGMGIRGGDGCAVHGDPPGWGAAGLLLFPADSLIHQVLLAVILVGIAAIFMPMLTADFHSHLVFALCVVTPVTAMLLARPETATLITGGISAAVTGVLIINA